MSRAACLLAVALLLAPGLSGAGAPGQEPDEERAGAGAEGAARRATFEPGPARPFSFPLTIRSVMRGP